MLIKATFTSLIEVEYRIKRILARVTTEIKKYIILE